MRVGVVGLGGLGQMGIQLARAMGNTVTAISTSPAKEAAAREIGADSFVVSTSKESMAAAAGSLHLIVNTVSAKFDANLYLPLLVSSIFKSNACFHDLYLGTKWSYGSNWSKPGTSCNKCSGIVLQELWISRFYNWWTSRYSGKVENIW